MGGTTAYGRATKRNPIQAVAQKKAPQDCLAIDIGEKIGGHKTVLLLIYHNPEPKSAEEREQWKHWFDELEGYILHLQRKQGAAVLMVGDVNAHMKHTGYATDNWVARRMQELAATTNMNWRRPDDLGEGSYTFVARGSGARAYLDHVWVQREVEAQVKEVRVDTNTYLKSQHRPVRVRLQTEAEHGVPLRPNHRSQGGGENSLMTRGRRPSGRNSRSGPSTGRPRPRRTRRRGGTTGPGWTCS